MTEKEKIMGQQVSERIKREAHLYRLHQAERLLAAHGYKRLGDGNWARPTQVKKISKR